MKKYHEIAAASLFNKKVRNNKCKVLGVTLIIAYLSCNNKTGKFHEKKIKSENVLRSFIEFWKEWNVTTPASSPEDERMKDLRIPS